MKGKIFIFEKVIGMKHIYTVLPSFITTVVSYFIIAALNYS